MKDDLLPAVAAMEKFELMAGRSHLWIARPFGKVLLNDDDELCCTLLTFC